MFAVVSMLCRVVFEAYISAWLAIGSDWKHHFVFYCIWKQALQ